MYRSGEFHWKMDCSILQPIYQSKKKTQQSNLILNTHQATTSTNPVDQSKIITQRILKQLRGRVNQLLKYNGYDELKYSAKKVYMQRKIYISEQLNKDTLSYTYFHFE